MFVDQLHAYVRISDAVESRLFADAVGMSGAGADAEAEAESSGSRR